MKATQPPTPLNSDPPPRPLPIPFGGRPLGPASPCHLSTGSGCRPDPEHRPEACNPGPPGGKGINRVYLDLNLRPLVLDDRKDDLLSPLNPCRGLLRHSRGDLTRDGERLHPTPRLTPFAPYRYFSPLPLFQFRTSNLGTRPWLADPSSTKRHEGRLRGSQQLVRVEEVGDGTGGTGVDEGGCPLTEIPRSTQTLFKRPSCPKYPDR